MNAKKEINKDEVWACGHHVSDEYFAKVKKLLDRKNSGEIYYERIYDFTKDKYDD